MADCLIFSTPSGKAVYSDSALSSPQPLNTTITDGPTCFRVQKRVDGDLRKWTFDNLDEAIKKRDAIFA